MNFLTSGIILYSFYQCICMNRDGSEAEKGNSGIIYYGDGDPVFATTLKLTPDEAKILQHLLKSHETSKPKETPEGSGQSGSDLQKIRRNNEGIPVFAVTLELTEEEAEILKRLLATQNKSGGGHDPRPEPSAPPEERGPPYAPGYGLPGPSHLQGGYHGYYVPGGHGTGHPPQGPYGPPTPGYGLPSQGYTGGAGGYGGHYAPGGYPPQPGPSATPAPGYVPPVQGYTGGAGGYGTGYQPQGPYQTPGATGPPAPGYVPPVQGYTGGAGGYGGHYAPGGYGTGYQPQGPYGPPGATGPPPPGYVPPGATGYTGGAGGYGGHYAPGGYPPQPGPSAPPTPGYGQQGATGYTPPEGQGPTDPGDDPSGPSDPSGSPKKGKSTKKLIPLQTRDTKSSDDVEVLEYDIPKSGGKHRKHKAKDGVGFDVVFHGCSVVWTMIGPHHAVEVTLIGVGKPKKKIDIKLSDGTRKRFGKRGKNKPWEPEVEKK